LHALTRSLESSSRPLHAKAAERVQVTDTSVNAVRISETINGRTYVIEVRPVGRDRWRAQLARRGATTAVMPFYGTTPDQAASQLMRWLARASGLVQLK
jgi:hypothetical protein